MKFYFAYFGTVAGMTGIMIGAIQEWWWLIAICLFLTLMCMIWIVFIFDQREDQVRKNRRAIRELKNWIRDHDDEHNQLRDSICQKVDKRPPQNVRTGSHPSVTYEAMKVLQEKGGDEHDGRAEDQAIAEVQKLVTVDTGN